MTIIKNINLVSCKIITEKLRCDVVIGIYFMQRRLIFGRTSLLECLFLFLPSVD
jgi:hypothetical protein